MMPHTTIAMTFETYERLFTAFDDDAAATAQTTRG